MIVYVDTSAFVKLVVDEDGADETRRWFDAASLAAIGVRERALARSASASITVAAFDRRLLEAAEREGFATLGGALT